MLLLCFLLVIQLYCSIIDFFFFCCSVRQLYLEQNFNLVPNSLYENIFMSIFLLSCAHCFPACGYVITCFTDIVTCTLLKTVNKACLLLQQFFLLRFDSLINTFWMIPLNLQLNVRIN